MLGNHTLYCEPQKIGVIQDTLDLQETLSGRSNSKNHLFNNLWKKKKQGIKKLKPSRKCQRLCGGEREIERNMSP